MMEHLLKYKNNEKRIKYIKSIVNMFPDKANELEVELKELEELQARLREAVNSFSEPLKQILEFKYFRGLTLESFSKEINYSYNYVRTVHSWFIRSLSELEPYIKY